MSLPALAKVIWRDPQTAEVKEYVLTEGATATLGRSSSNDIHVPEQHVSRQHAVIRYTDGVFTISDLGSANGTFVNGQQISEPFPLFADDVIRLYEAELTFSATVTEEEERRAEEHGTLITATTSTGKDKLVITSGPQEGQVIPLLLEEIRIGRAVSNADWEISLQDTSVSRPHARMEHRDNVWVVYDLGSSNGTLVNDAPVNEKGRPLRDGDVIRFGKIVVLFRAG